MSDFGKLIASFRPDQAGGGLFGDGVSAVEVHAAGVILRRKKGEAAYRFSDIEKLLARNYLSPTPSLIRIEVHLTGQKPIKFGLHPNLKDTNILLSAFSAWQLGDAFPGNLDSLDIDLGGIGGTSIRIKDGRFVFGQNTAPFHDMEWARNGGNGFYQIKLRDVKHKLAVSPDYAPNILTTLMVLEAIAARNG